MEKKGILFGIEILAPFVSKKYFIERQKFYLVPLKLRRTYKEIYDTKNLDKADFSSRVFI